MVDTILLLSYDHERLKRREEVFRAAGFDVVSTQSPAQARFEIEMGNCEIFVTCDLVPHLINRDLMKLFRQRCPTGGWIVLVSGNQAVSKLVDCPQANVCISDSSAEAMVQAVEARLLGNEPKGLNEGAAD